MLDTHRDVVDIVQLKFSTSEQVKCVHLNVSLLNADANSNDYRLLALLANTNGSYAIFVLVSEKVRPTSISDLTIETAIPIDEHFFCDTESINNCQNEIIFVITKKSTKYKFRIEIGTESSNFATEVVKSKEDSALHPLNFSWLDRYTQTMDENDVDSLVVSRHRVAHGQTVSNRDSILRYQLKLKEPEYTELREFSIFVGTWNVNGQPATVSLKQWLTCDVNPPDLYAIGLQEIDLSKEAFLFNDTPREAEWQRFVMDGIHSDEVSYSLVALVRLVGMQLIVLVNSKHQSYIKNVAVDSVGTGLLGKMGNKGGVAVRLELHNTSLCFVNSHLAAYIEEFERRNQDYKDINCRINFRRYPTTIKQHDQVYWLGDLNYRITDLNTNQVKTLLNCNEIETLLKSDQLNQQKERGNVFLDYTEGEVTFPPTYKYDLNTDTFDTSEKARPPAWTDRILFYGAGIVLNEYRSHMAIRMSDHKPVSALFTAQISVVDQVRFRRIHEDLLKRMDKLENEFLPQVTIDQNEVIFDLIKFRQPQAREIIIANTGQVPSEFEFIKKLNESSYCKKWLQITPHYGIIDPGEKCDVRLEVNLETDLEQIYDILVLHLKGGKDMFITVSGNCQRSCFTTDVQILCRTPAPILSMDDVQWNLVRNLELPVLYAVPRELWLLVDHLYRHGLKTRELFERCGLHDELIAIRDWLDFGSADPLPGTIYAIAEALLVFLSFTKEPIVPYDIQDACVSASSIYQSCQEVILKMDEINRNIFLYICLFLQELLRYSSDNGYDAKTLASLFGDILLRDRIRNSKPQANRGKSNFIYIFLVNDLSTLISSSR